MREGGPVAFGESRYGVTTSGTEEPDVNFGHWLEADLSPTDSDGIERPTVASAYLHSGQLDTEKIGQRYTHLELVDVRMTEFLVTACDGEPQVVVVGDLNVVCSECDIGNWKPNHSKITGAMDEKIAHLESWFVLGQVGVSRHLVGDEEQRPYTRRSQCGKAFDDGAGWRIDYQVLTPALAERVHGVIADRTPDYTSC